MRQKWPVIISLRFLSLGVSGNLTQIGLVNYFGVMEFKIVSSRVAVHPVSLASALMMKSPRTPCSDEPRRSKSIALQEDLHVDSFTGNPGGEHTTRGKLPCRRKLSQVSDCNSPSACHP